MRPARMRAALAAALATLAVALLAAPAAGAAVTLPENFEDQTIFSGLNQPTIVRFAPGGEVFVGEKGGQILVYENVHDSTPEVFANLAKPAYDYEDHGLLGMAIDPLFQLGRPYVYALYTFNHELADKAAQEPTGVEPRTVTPRWPSAGPGYENDECENSEKAHEEGIVENPGCEVSGVLVRLEADPGATHAEPNAAAPEEKVLLEGWCQQATTHSIGDLGFGPEGDLYVSGGEGAMYSEADYGQFGNPCEDPVEYEEYEPGKTQVKRLTALGGSLRSQSVLRDHGEPDHPTLLSGTVLRIDPDTGEGVPGNPYFTTGPAGEPSTEENMQRIFAFGFRQPWRFTFNGATNSLFVDNVGNGSFEEIDRLDLGATTAYNSGWPCYEGGESGSERNYAYSGQYEEGGEIIHDPSIQFCIDQYEEEDHGNPETNAPFYAYAHNGPVVPGDRCFNSSPLPTDVAGNAFYEGTSYPSAYQGAFFFADAIRGCIYMMEAGAGGEPDPSTARTFLSDTQPYTFPGVDLEQGPEGDLFYVELNGAGGGAVHRIVYTPKVYALTVGKAGDGSGTVSSAPAGIDCGAVCRAEFEEGTSVVLSGAPAAGSEAPSWSGCDSVDGADRCVVAVAGARSVTASFARSPAPVAPPSPPAAESPPAKTYHPPSIKKRPGKRTTKRWAKFVFRGQGETRFRCKLDGKHFSSCRHRRVYKHLRYGRHSFRVYAVDRSGTRLSANRVFHWKVLRKS